MRSEVPVEARYADEMAPEMAGWHPLDFWCLVIQLGLQGLQPPRYVEKFLAEEEGLDLLLSAQENRRAPKSRH